MADGRWLCGRDEVRGWLDELSGDGDEERGATCA
jgi:hypothetical protein